MARLAAARGAAVSDMVPDTAAGRDPPSGGPASAAGPGGARPSPPSSARTSPLEPVRTLAALDPEVFVVARSTRWSPSGLAGQTGDRLTLSHALVRDAVYGPPGRSAARAAPGRRRAGRAAPGRGRRAPPRALARSPALDRVVAATEEAARAAREAQAWEDAARLPPGPRPASLPTTPARPRLLRGAGGGAARRGRPRRRRACSTGGSGSRAGARVTPAVSPRRRWDSPRAWVASRCGWSTASRTTC